MKTRKHHRKLYFEDLEPRIVLSLTLAIDVDAAGPADAGPAEVGGMQHRIAGFNSIDFNSRGHHRHGDHVTWNPDPSTDAIVDVTVLVHDHLDLGDDTDQKLARFDDAIAEVNSAFTTFGVLLNLVKEIDITQPHDIHLHEDSTSACGGPAAALGCADYFLFVGHTGEFDDGDKNHLFAGENDGGGAVATVLSGFDWYIGSNPNAIGLTQYDYQTVATQELLHLVGLSHDATVYDDGDGGVEDDPEVVGNTDGRSVMHGMLGTDIVRRSMSTHDQEVLGHLYGTIDIGGVNQSPVADAGSNQSVTTGDLVQLDGSASSDPEDDPLTYTWMLVVPFGSDATLSNANIVNPTFTADIDGDYLVTLVVNDGESDSAPDVATITAGPAVPAGETMHVHDLDGAKHVKGKSGKTEVSVTVTIHDDGDVAVANATVMGSWTENVVDMVSGVTDTNGNVTFSTGNINGFSMVTFTVDDVVSGALTYDSSGTDNHDADGDSNGTIITVTNGGGLFVGATHGLFAAKIEAPSPAIATVPSNSPARTNHATSVMNGAISDPSAERVAVSRRLVASQHPLMIAPQAATIEPVVLTSSSVIEEVAGALDAVFGSTELLDDLFLELSGLAAL